MGLHRCDRPGIQLYYASKMNSLSLEESRYVQIFAALTFILLLFSCSKTPVSHDNLQTEILTQLRRDGSDTSKPHGLDFYFYFPREAAARHAGHRLTQNGYRVEVRPAATGTNWLCLARTNITPDTAPLAEMGTLFEQLAQAFLGEFDGWEPEVIKP
jgi:hypothetical protein